MGIFPPIPGTVYDTARAATVDLTEPKASLALEDPKATLVRLSGRGPGFGVAGITAPDYPREVLVVNVGQQAIILRHEDGSVELANRLICPDDVELALDRNDVVRLVYDPETQRWRVI